MAKENVSLQEYLFVDGYNIINNWEILKEKKVENLAEAREELIEIMLEYQSFSGVQVIIVFDAHLVKGNIGTKEERNGLIIVYTQEHETADHFIERSIDKLGRRRRVRVATSDRLEQEIVLGRGATRVSARELEMEVRSMRRLINKQQIVKNQQNDYHFESLDEKSIEALKNIKFDD